MTHTGGNPFACYKCEKSFTQSGDLKKHGRIHTGEKPFACSQCDKAFANKSTLKKHGRIHSGGKPFAIRMMKLVRLGIGIVVLVLSIGY